MRIGIDARFLTHAQAGGFRTYTRSLIFALAELQLDHEFLLYTNQEFTEAHQFPANFTVTVIPETVPAIGMAWREQALLAKQAKRDRLDLFHAPALTAPLRLPCPSIVTLHDTIWLQPSNRKRGLTSIKRQLMNYYYRYIPQQAASRAAAIITVSQSARLDIAKFLPITPDKIYVTSEAAAPRYRPQEPAQAANFVRDQYHLEPGYVLAMGSADPRKNAGGLLKAYSALPECLRDLHPLAVVWAHPSLAGTVADSAHALGIDKHLHFLQNVSDDGLVALYNSAAVFAFPSRYEGFGLPLLEAMACGTPVIAANNSSLPEIAGDAAVLLDSEDTDGWTQAISQALTDHELQKRLARAGLLRASEFSWRRCALETVAAYEAAVSG